MKSLFSKNGVQVSAEEANILVASEAFEKNQAVYTSLRTYSDQVFQLDPHLKRLRQSAELKGFELSASLQDIRQWIRKIVSEAPFSPHFIRVTATPADIFIQCRHLVIEEETSAGVRAIVVPARRTNVKAKVVATPETISANQQAKQAGAYEALLLDESRGVLTEGAYSNLLWVKDGVLHWCDDALDGITQGLVKNLAVDLDLELREGTLPLSEIASCDEVFVTQTSRGIVPITQVDDMQIGGGSVGPHTKALMEAYSALLPRQNLQ